MRFNDTINIRHAIAQAIESTPEELGCFTVIDHDDQPMLIVMHGGKHIGVWEEKINGCFTKL